MERRGREGERECVCVWGREGEEGGRVRRERGSSCSSCLDKNDVIDLVFPVMRGCVIILEYRLLVLHIIEEQLAPVPLKFQTYSPQQALSLTPSLFSLPFSPFPLPLSHSLLLFH